MSPLVYILLAIALFLSLFLVLPFLFRPKYSVIKRLGALQLSNKLNSIRISTVIIKASGRKKHPEKGLFVYGIRQNTVGSLGNSSSLVEYSEIFPVSDQEIDEMIILLKSQPVFSVSWRKNKPVTLSVDGPSEVIKLVIESFSWMDFMLLVDMRDGDVGRLLKMFEALKSENDFA